MNTNINQPNGKKNFPDKWFWILSALIIFVALISRFVEVELKPFHHDESLHAYYSHIVSTGGVREYDALLHGPFLYYFVGFFQYIASGIDTGLGESDFVAHFPAALFGVLVVSIPLLIRNFIGKFATIAMMLFLLISPTTMYFGRFLREDVFTSIWVLGTVFGLLISLASSDADIGWEITLPRKDKATGLNTVLKFSYRTLGACFAAAMLAFHFTNKENSFLHTGLWILAAALIIGLGKFLEMDKVKNTNIVTTPTQKKSRNVYVPVIFAFIFILFFSSFFRHSGHWWDGVLDGLYRKSLVYWWGQDQIRRIDGPFDYHLPILANYEFLLLPFLATAWFRAIGFSRDANLLPNKKRFFLTDGNAAFYAMLACVVLVILTFILPRIPLVSEAYSVIDGSTSENLRSCKADAKPWACYLHISHSRHLLQILSYVIAGGFAFLSLIHAKKRYDAFLWFWFVGAIGTYSYVGEKVPWLTVYIVLPLLLIAALEVGRTLSNSDLPVYNENELPQTSSKKLLYFTLIWLVIAAPFTAFKAWKVSFPNAANPDERLIFTQTTPAVKELADRFEAAASNSHERNVRIGMSGEATWPMAWYSQKYKDFDFINGKDSEAIISEITKKKRFDVLFLNDEYGSLAQLERAFPQFSIYRVPLRAWWVPKPNPTLLEMLRYFFTGVVYPLDPATKKPKADPEVGKGDAKVLYLEYVGPESPFKGLPPPKKATLLKNAIVENK